MAQAITHILEAMEDAERKAWDALSRYKFLMFGYHAAQWVNLRKLLLGSDQRLPANPWRDVVSLARDWKEANR